MQNISENLATVHHKLTACLQAAERPLNSVRLLCVSKTKSVEQIMEAYACGERHFGESYAVEAAEKIRRIREAGIHDIVWHFIGPVQKNKTRTVAENFDMAESIDREIVARRLNDQRPDGLKPLDVLIEVNISGEEQKSGCSPAALDALAQLCASLPRLHFRGLMGIAKETDNKQEILDSFVKLRELFMKLKALYPDLDTLSMGMTGDMAEAVSAGSTEVRIGTAIFGPREYKHNIIESQKLGFVGCGNMASCFFYGIHKLHPRAALAVSEPDAQKRARFEAEGATVSSSNADVCRESSVIFLGVKPQILTGVLRELASSGIDFGSKLVISMAAGFRLASIEKLLGSSRIVRIMPNTPARIGLGLTAVCFGSGVRAEDQTLVRELLKGVGKCVEGTEEELDVIGAVCGCGPAFVFRFMEALIAESVRHGISPENARAMVEQTVQGSVALVRESPERSLAELREAVTSKGGTTYAGLCQMTAGRFEQMMQNTIQASLDRTFEFEKMF